MRGFYIRDEWFVVFINNLMDIIASTVYVQSCDTEVL